MKLHPLAEPRLVAPDIHALTTFLELPVIGTVAINAFLLRAEQPTLIDTGLAAHADLFVRHVESIVPLDELRWIWLTHVDADHVGALEPLLARAPRAKVVTNFLGMGKRGLALPIDPARFYLVNPGQTFDLGDRRLQALRPPTYDAPETTALFEAKSRVLFSSDCFGAGLPGVTGDASQIAASDLREGVFRWAAIDSPWLCNVEEKPYRASLDAIARLGAHTILSSHLPPAHGMTETLLSYLSDARGAPPIVLPDQAAMMAMMQSAA